MISEFDVPRSATISEMDTEKLWSQTINNAGPAAADFVLRYTVRKEDSVSLRISDTTLTARDARSFHEALSKLDNVPETRLNFNDAYGESRSEVLKFIPLLEILSIEASNPAV